jgi:hypothetical protein
LRLFKFALLSTILIYALPEAHGAGVFVDACGAVQNFSGDLSTAAHCSIGTTADNAIGGASGVAGRNFFENHLSPIHFYGDDDAFAGVGVWTVTTNPTWSPGVILVDTFLRLDGSVKMQGPGSLLTITLTGTLGGPAQTITRSFAWTGAPTEDILNIADFAKQAPAGAAVETLTIAITGRARYDVDGSPTFLGAPEPGTWALMGTGLAGLLALGFKKRSKTEKSNSRS